MIALRAIATAALVTLAGMPAYAQALGQTADDGIPMWRVIAALLICLALAVAGAFALRSKIGVASGWPGVSRADKRLRIVESLRLPNQVTLSVIACDGAEWLISTSSQGAQLLGPASPIPGKRRLPEADGA